MIVKAVLDLAATTRISLADEAAEWSGDAIRSKEGREAMADA